MRILSTTRNSTPEPGLLWIQHVQRHLEKLLLVGRTKARHLPREEWQTIKTRWKDMILDACPDLRQAQGKPIAATVRSEAHYDGFRVQKIVVEAMPGWQVGLNLFLPPSEGPFTPIICPCGHGPKWQDDHQIPPQVLARNGFAAALFDAPMFGERERDNDHFIQGAQAQMYGLWSNFFFLLDPIRVADYLQTRSDMTFEHGMGVTGVSGGGYAALYLPQYDARVRAIVPVCSVTPLEAFPIHGLYTGCPENYVRGQALLGMDYDDLLALASPLPCLVIGGTRDTLFHTSHMRHSVRKAKAIFALEGIEERLDAYYEECEHHYTATMAGEAARWFRRWLLGEDGAAETRVEPLPREALDCGASSDGMLQFHRREAARLRQTRRITISNEVITELFTLHDDPRPTRMETIVALSEWGPGNLTKRVAHVEDGVPIPLLELACPEAPAGTLVCFTDAGKFGPLRGFNNLCRRIVSADLRGFGELKPEPSDYDIYPWCGIDRVLGDLLWLSGDTAMGQQVRDALRILEAAVGEIGEMNSHSSHSSHSSHQLKTQNSKLKTSSLPPLTVYGRGEAALPALFAGLLHPGVQKIILEDFPCTFERLATAANPTWSRWQFVPDVLKYFDLPELFAGRADRQFLLVNPCDAQKERLDEIEALRLYGLEESHVTVHVDFDAADTAGTMREWLAQPEPSKAPVDPKLAIDGGAPVRTRPFPAKYLGADLTGRAELRKVKEAIAGRTLFRHYGLGTPVMAETFEARIREKFGVSYALGVTSGSAALNTALAGLGVGPGDEVILPAFAWFSCYNAIVLHGALPVFCEIDRSLNIDPRDVERKITPRTKAIIAVHYQGAAAGLDELLALARPHGIKVLEDCAQALGAQYHGKYVGAVGHVGAFSLQGNKMLTAGEGGLVITDDPEIFERAVRYHDLGFLRPTFESQLKHGARDHASAGMTQGARDPDSAGIRQGVYKPDSAGMRNARPEGAEVNSQGSHEATPGTEAYQNILRRQDVGAPIAGGDDPRRYITSCSLVAESAGYSDERQTPHDSDSARMRNASLRAEVNSQGSHDLSAVAIAKEEATPGTEADQISERRQDVGATIAGSDDPHYATTDQSPAEPAGWPSGEEFPGNQYRMNELTAAVMLAQLDRLDWMAARCRHTWTAIRERIKAAVPDARFRRANSDGDLGIALFLDLQTPERAAQFARALIAEGIPVGPSSGLSNLLDTEYIQQARPPHPNLPPLGVTYPPALAPNTPSIIDSMVAIPITPRYTAADAEDIANAVVKVYRGLMVKA